MKQIRYLSCSEYLLGLSMAKYKIEGTYSNQRNSKSGRYSLAPLKKKIKIKKQNKQKKTVDPKILIQKQPDD